MARLLLIALAVVFVCWWLRRDRRPAEPAQPVAPTAPRTDKTIQPMVDCAHCGLHLPLHEALAVPAADAHAPRRYACCAEHQAALVTAQDNSR